MVSPVVVVVCGNRKETKHKMHVPMQCNARECNTLQYSTVQYIATEEKTARETVTNATAKGVV